MLIILQVFSRLNRNPSEALAKVVIPVKTGIQKVYK
jgi:hypothetical protein